MPKLEVVNANNVIEFNPQKANFKLKNTGGPKGETGAQGPKGAKGDTGAQGPAGASASVTVGSTTTLSPGADATVTNSGDTRNAILNFGIPTGARGPKGDTGAQGDIGPMGPKGAKGDTGAAATVQVGNTNTGAPGTNAQVTNAGNEHFAVFNFTIPRGDKGDKGDKGAQGPAGADGADGFSPSATVTQEGLNAEISITDKDGTTTATVPGFGVQVVESLPATGSSNVIYLERDSNSASGNPISIADAVEAPLKSLEIQGNTTQNGTPTPSAPVPVQTVTGENTLTISDGTNTQSYEVNLGKNLFDKDNVVNGIPSASDGSITSTSGAGRTSDYIPVMPNTSYSHTGHPAGWATVAWYKADKSFIRRVDNITTTTSPSGAAYARVSCAQSNLDTCQFEAGVPTSYAPYFTPIELCKIGTYQDYIWKDGDAWKIHKATGKALLNDYANTAVRGTTNASNKYRFRLTIPGVFPAATVSTKVQSYCSHLTAGSVGNTHSRIQCVAIDVSPNNYVFMFSTDTEDMTLDDFKTWLTGKNMSFYYPLATPTDTEITNETLIAQLEAILAGGTQAGANTITLTPSAGATGALEVEYYDSYNSYLWVNNRWEKFAHLG